MPPKRFQMFSFEEWQKLTAKQRYYYNNKRVDLLPLKGSIQQISKQTNVKHNNSDEQLNELVNIIEKLQIENKLQKSNIKSLQKYISELESKLLLTQEYISSQYECLTDAESNNHIQENRLSENIDKTFGEMTQEEINDFIDNAQEPISDIDEKDISPCTNTN